MAAIGKCVPAVLLEFSYGMKVESRVTRTRVSIPVPHVLRKSMIAMGVYRGIKGRSGDRIETGEDAEAAVASPSTQSKS